MSICKVDGCDKPVGKMGWCIMHHTRWYKHGDPLAGGTFRGSTKAFIYDNLEYQGDECLIWPYAKHNGYGVINLPGFTTKSVHRIMCILTKGEPPTPTHEATHDCGRGAYGCVNPKHLSWKTPLGNVRDKRLHGTQHMGENVHWAKLTEAQALQIKHSSEDRSTLSERFSISRRQVIAIQNGERWRHLK